MSEERWLTHLCFHGIGVPRRSLEDGEARYWIDRDALRWVLDLAAADPNVRVSFDDGNASDIEIGLEELLQRGLRASFFPLAGRLNKAGSAGRCGRSCARRRRHADRVTRFPSSIVARDER